MKLLQPVYEPIYDGNEQQYLLDCLSSGWLSGEGDYVKRFEKSWANYCHMPFGVSVNSGTTALELAVAALELPKGSEIIVPAFTIISCVNAILKAGCRPVLVDCDPITYCLDPDHVDAAVNKRTCAIMPVHIYGHPAPMREIIDIAYRHNLYVIEDAAEAHGAKANSKIVGSEGHLSCFSFYANKTVSCGEGGMVLTKDLEHAERVRSLRNLCFRPEQRFKHTEMGSVCRMTNMQAAVGLAQVEKIADHLAMKRQIAGWYTSRLRGLAQLILPEEKSWAFNTYWMYAIVLSDNVPFEAIEFASRLRRHGIETRPFFLGMHEQPVFKHMRLFRGEKYPVTERISRRGLYLPSGLTLTEDAVDCVYQRILDSFY